MRTYGAGVHIIESFTKARNGKDHENEDVLVIAPHIVAVIDGATSSTAGASRAGGLLAATVIGAVLDEREDLTDPHAIIAACSTALRDAVEAMGGDPDDDLAACASLVAYLPTARVLVRVGDCAFARDGVWDRPRGDLERAAAAARAWHLRACLDAGDDPSTLAVGDPGRALITPLLHKAAHFRNRIGSPCASAVCSPRPTPPEYVEIVDCAGTRELALASDGYPDLREDLAASEAALSARVAADPLGIDLARPMTKGACPGGDAYDDRTYVRLRID